MYGRKHALGGGGKKWIVYGAALVSFVLFSLSRFQLPHYIIIIFPHLSIAVAAWWYRQATNCKVIKYVYALQLSIFYLALFFISFLFWFMRLEYSVAGSIIYIIITGGILFFIYRQANKNLRILLFAYGFALVLYSFMDMFFYPQILRYQSGMRAATYVNMHLPRGSRVACDSYDTQFHFYADSEPVVIDGNVDSLAHFIRTPHNMAYISAGTLEAMQSKKIPLRIVQALPYFHITRLTKQFLRASTRSSTTSMHYLVEGTSDR